MKLLVKILLFFIPLTILLVGAAILASRSGLHNILVEEVYNRGLAQAAGDMQIFSKAFESGTETALFPPLQDLKDQTQGAQVAALNRTGRVLAHTNVMEKNKVYADAPTTRMLRSDLPVSYETAVKGEAVLIISVPVWREAGEKEDFLLSTRKQRLGTIILEMPLTRTEQLQNRLFLRQAAFLILAAGGLSLGLILFTILTILRPARRLADGILKVNEGQYELTVPVYSNDELGLLTAAFNRMAETLGKTTVSRDKLTEEVAERRLVEDNLKFNNILLSTQQETSLDGILVVDKNGGIISFNRNFIDMWGIPAEVVESKSDDLALRSVMGKLAEPEQFLQKVKYLYEHRREASREEVVLKDSRTFDCYSAPMNGTGDQYYGRVWYFRDISERRQTADEKSKLEEQLRQSQKMEAVGQLAGGVAHDFNNILTAIKCYAEFIRNDLAPGDPKLEDVQEILDSTERAVSLTRQLLAFSRRQIMAPRVVDINMLLGNMTNMLRRIIGEDITLETRLFAAPCLAMVDPGQVEQVILNLAVNARDATHGSGTIKLETEIINPPEEFFDTHPDLAIGPLVCLKVRDTGSGMNKEVKDHIFEPFFTTKEQGKGTGLGLSTVFGIVKQSHGEIEVESEPGKGSVFTVYLPLMETPLQDKDKDKHAPVKGHESVLFVEDEESLRRLGERVLRAGGYTVLIAADGQAALKLMEERGKPVDLLMTDVVMPGMSGRELALELARRKLIGRALYMSGYTDDAIVKHGVLEPGIAFIYKPFTVDTVMLKLREVLDGPADKAKA